MIDPAPFRLSLIQRRALGAGVIASAVAAVASFGFGFYALTHEEFARVANAFLALSVLVALVGLGLYIRRALGLLHQRQLWTMAALTDPHTPELAAEPAPGAEVPSPRPSADPEASREDESA